MSGTVDDERERDKAQTFAAHDATRRLQTLVDLAALSKPSKRAAKLRND
jgi:hypothetical protein